MRADDEKDHSPPIEKRSVPAGGGAGAAAAPALEHREAEQRLAIARGPRKKVDEGPPKPRLTSHKVRSQWFQARAAWPYREASPYVVVEARQQLQKRAAAAAGVATQPPPAPAREGAATVASGTQAHSQPGAKLAPQQQWHCIGPTNIGGRMTSIIAHPQHPDRIWAGAAGGGVWESSDAGHTWSSTWDTQTLLNIGSLAMDPKNPEVLYCGTGEANHSADSYPGIGVYWSRNAGKKWELLADARQARLPKRIGALAVDPFNSRRIFLGGVNSGIFENQDDLGGLYISEDQGKTWQRFNFISDNNYRCHSIAFHPTWEGWMYATFTEQGNKNGIWRSTDGGRTWVQLTNGLPERPRIGRTSLALCDSKPNMIYAFGADEASESRDLVLGVFRSDDGGDNWREISGNYFLSERQMSYGNAIAVSPDDPDFVVCGGVDLHRSRDGGRTWRKITFWNKERGDTTGRNPALKQDPQYAHADHHALLIPSQTPHRIYSANDGGVDVSDDGGDTWSNRSNGLAVTMYYDIDVCQSDEQIFGGGAQDNGTLITDDGKADDHREILGGDGGWMVIDPAEPSHLLCSHQFMGIYRYRHGQVQDISPPAAEKDLIWMCRITMDPSDPDRIYVGSNRVWFTDDDGDTWKVISPDLDGSPITALEVAPADSQRIYVGTENGGIFRSVNGGANWSANIAGSTLPARIITQIATDAMAADTLIVTVGLTDHSHVFRSDNGGLIWRDIDQGNLPNVPHQVVVVRPDDPKTIFVGNDLGVFVSEDDGTSWNDLSRNLPHVMVIDLVYHPHDRSLTAATYGRSLWRLKIE